jgi:uncharacterized protein YndB with AHSA1/START domain
MFDVTTQLTGTRREVGTRVHEGVETRVVTITREYPATAGEVWDACTNPERIPRWFLPVSGDLRPGGRYQLEGNAGGTVQRCDPPRSFAATWEYDEQVSWIELHLEEAGDGTRLRLEHLVPVDDQRWRDFGPGAVGAGWDMALLGLAANLAGAPPIDPAEVAGWLGSPEALGFLTDSATAWGAADEADGTPAERARTATARTIAAYTGQPDPTQS